MFSAVDPYSTLFEDAILKEKRNRPGHYSEVKTITITKSQFEGLDLDVQLFLGSLINKGISTHFDEIIGRRLESYLLAPNVRYLKHLMTQLEAGTYSPYGINIKIDPDVARKYFKPYNKLNLSLEQQAQVWKKVALNEVVEIFYGSLESKGLLTDQHEAIVPILSDLLVFYSVGQVVNLIWQALNCKYDEYLKGKRDKQHTANLVIYTCKNFGEYKMKYRKNVECFNRPLRFPQSEMSRYLYNDVLKIGIRGFKKIPCYGELYLYP